jgi:hypothetical protein
VLFLAACGDSSSGDADGGGCPTCGNDASGDVRDASSGGTDAARDAWTGIDATPPPLDAQPDTPPLPDAGRDAIAPRDAGIDAPSVDAGIDAPSVDAAPDVVVVDATPDVGIDAPPPVDAGLDTGTLPDAPSNEGGVIGGGPCLSGAAGATAFRIRWIDAGGQAQVVYEAYGLPDTTNESAGAYGYVIGFTPQFVDTALAQGGLLLDSSDFVDMGMSTVGLSSISSATISIYGRSYDVSTNGSFDWMSFTGSDSTPTDFVSNVPPYQWYSGDLSTAIDVGDSNVLIRIKAGPSSGALAVNAIEICLQAQ